MKVFDGRIRLRIYTRRYPVGYKLQYSTSSSTPIYAIKLYKYAYAIVRRYVVTVRYGGSAKPQRPRAAPAAPRQPSVGRATPLTVAHRTQHGER